MWLEKNSGEWFDGEAYVLKAQRADNAGTYPDRIPIELKNLDRKTGPPFVHAMGSALPSGKRLHNWWENHHF